MGKEALAARARFTVALAGGSTPRGLYQRLAGSGTDFDWSSTDFFWGDERAVPLDDERSNYRLAAKELLDPLGVSDDRRHAMQTTGDDVAAAAAYQATIARVLGVDPAGPPPRLDLVLLGIGGDGHTASLFPGGRRTGGRRTGGRRTGADALHATDQWIAATEAPVAPFRRLTMTLPLLNRAGTVLFLVTGAAKADTVGRILCGPFDPDRLPAQSVRPESGDLAWFLDRDAAARLGPNGATAD